MTDLYQAQANKVGEILNGSELCHVLSGYLGDLAILGVTRYPGRTNEFSYAVDGWLGPVHLLEDYAPGGEPFISLRVANQMSDRSGTRSPEKGSRWTLPMSVFVSTPDIGGNQFEWTVGVNGETDTEYVMYTNHTDNRNKAFNPRQIHRFRT